MLKLLIVDDEIDNRKDDYLNFYREALERQLYGIAFAKTGEEGLEIVQKDTKQEIALILLDLRMDQARLNGVALANALAKSYLDRKILVYTAYPEYASSFSPEAKRNVITVIERSKRSPEVIRDLVNIFILGGDIEVASDLTVNKDSRFVGYPTIRKLVKTLSPDLRVNLIREILPFFPAQTLLELKDTIPEEIDQVLAEAVDRDMLKKWAAQKQLQGLLPPGIPSIEELNDLVLEIRDIPHKNGKIYQYHYLRWSISGAFEWKYLKKRLVETLPLELQNPPPYPGTLPVVYRSMKRKNELEAF
jgi:CheY-like chemotaxis protein